MKISFIAENDWANILTEYAYCLNKHSKDIEAKSICFRPHPFKYPLQHDYDLQFCSEEQKLEAKQFLEESDVIIFGEEGAIQPTNYRVLEVYKQILGIDLLNSNKKLIIWHPGSHYRNNFNFYNNHPLKNKIYKHLYALDLYKLSPQLENDIPLLLYKYHDFDTDKLLEDFIKKMKSSRIILHIPSNPIVKGTNIISNSMKNLPNGYEYKTFNNISNTETLLHKSKALIYIDQFNNIGTYGTSAYESLINSSIVFSSLQNSLDGIYRLTGDYNLPVVNLGNDPSKLKKIIFDWLELSDTELINVYQEIIHWIDKYYSPNAIINNINKIIS